MIHIATVHWKTDRWIDVQLDYIRKYIQGPYRVYASLHGVKAAVSQKYFYSSFSENPNHAEKLNQLAQRICSRSHSDQDLIIFLDGDAFPIRPLDWSLRDQLSRHPLIAVQRLENVGERQPHPSFCATTIGFWKEIEGDWRHGGKWKNSRGKMVTEVGGNLLSILRKRKVRWRPLLRTNRNNLHPLWFGIYDGLIYHHGAGFRRALTILDVLEASENDPGENLAWMFAHMTGGEITPSLRRNSPHGRRVEKRIQDSEAKSKKVLKELKKNELFFLKFE